MSLKRMFGSSRTWFTFLVILLVCVIGYLISNQLLDRAKGLRAADELWNRDQNVEAVRDYKTLLSERDPLNKQYAVIVGNDRVRLYRRIISHEARFGNRAEARDWITKAYGEGINFEKADFENAAVHQLWSEVVADYQSPDAALKNRSLLDEASGKR